MIKETQITQRSTVCDLCDVTNQPSNVYSSATIHNKFHRLHDKDLCDDCFHAVIKTLISDRVITEESVSDAIVNTLVPSKMNIFPFTFPTR